jgi:hypothetical protein
LLEGSRVCSVALELGPGEGRGSDLSDRGGGAADPEARESSQTRRAQRPAPCACAITVLSTVKGFQGRVILAEGLVAA